MHLLTKVGRRNGRWVMRYAGRPGEQYAKSTPNLGGRARATGQRMGPCAIGVEARCEVKGHRDDVVSGDTTG